MGRGDCCALYFMMENIGYEWYNQNVKDMDKSGVIGGMTNDKKRSIYAVHLFFMPLFFTDFGVY